MSSIEWKHVEHKLTTTEIENVEKHFGVRFPVDYIECILENNGGYPSHRIFFVNGREEGINNFICVVDDEHGIIKTAQDISDRLESGLVPFARDAGGNYVCFDYRNNALSPSVVFWEHEKAFLGADDSIVKVADSFTQFMNSLQIFEDDDDN